MNAPINIALLQAAAAPVAPRKQPAVAHGTRVLLVGYEHDGLMLDLHGTLDSMGYDVWDVTLTGEQVAITALFSPTQLIELAGWCDRHLPSAHDLRLVSIDEARIERREWERNFEPP